MLAEEGIEYIADWVNDDQPYEMIVKSGRMVALPYTVELNDIPIYLIQNHRSPELFERAKDHFDTLYREGADSARVMCISTHPYITGAAHRIKNYDAIFDYISRFAGVVFMTGSEILDWYNGEVKERAVASLLLQARIESMQPDTQESNMYAELSRRCMGEAENYLHIGNNMQASEKGWGAVAQALKAIGRGTGLESRRAP